MSDTHEWVDTEPLTLFGEHYNGGLLAGPVYDGTVAITVSPDDGPSARIRLTVDSARTLAAHLLAITEP